MTKAYEDLKDYEKELSDLGQAQSLLGWDTQVMMPPQGMQARGDATTALSKVLHQKATSDEYATLINKAIDESDKLGEWDQKNLDKIKERHDLSNAISEDLNTAISKAKNECNAVWSTSKPEGDWKTVKPVLEKLLARTKEVAEIYSDILKKSPYDAMLHGFDEHSSMATIDPVFNVIKTNLPPIIQAITERQKTISFKKPPVIEIEKQHAFYKELVKIIGFTPDFGRLDQSSHPFCQPIGVGDIRMTTRYNENNFYDGLFPVFHEGGHAMYERNLPKDFISTSVGSYNGMKIHESQSLIFERHFLNNDHFFKYLHKTLCDQGLFKSQEFSVQDIQNHARKVKPSFIRVEADEATYPLHIIIRYEIEKGLFDGSITVDDIPDAWASGYQKYLGITPPNHTVGCLQDIHWYWGLFGYFPTYSLGAMTAAQLFDTLESDMQDIHKKLGNGDFRQINAWLTNKIHKWGSFYTPNELIEKATGQALNPDIFLNHLRKRYLDDF